MIGRELQKQVPCQNVFKPLRDEPITLFEELPDSNFSDWTNYEKL